ncbi:MAG: YeeE/YedE family protein [Bdellovibrionaceae bacterium]|nr:YeeE/YedE family protein [Pseudobdellovibrionaceae bacterium]
MFNDYLLAFLGGGLIGLSSILLLLFHGRIAGISGMLKGSFINNAPDKGWRISFIFGLIIMGLLLNIQQPQLFSINSYLNYWGIGLSGLLVGAGTYLGNGCTSGHGICGSSRLSIRSLVATVTFIVSGMLSVWMMKTFF